MALIMKAMTWNMNGGGNAAAKWSLVSCIDADVSVLQEARLPLGADGHVSRRHVKPAADRDDVVIRTKRPCVSKSLDGTAHGQVLEIECDGVRIFGLRSLPQLKEYYPKALLRIVDSIARSTDGSSTIPTIILGDFNASLDQGPGRDWTPPFRRLHELGFVDALCIKNGCDEQSLPCKLDHGKTLRKAGREYRIDHIYVNRVLKPKLRSAQIVASGWSLSDHCPVVVELDNS